MLVHLVHHDNFGARWKIFLVRCYHNLYLLRYRRQFVSTYEKIQKLDKVNLKYGICSLQWSLLNMASYRLKCQPWK